MGHCNSAAVQCYVEYFTYVNPVILATVTPKQAHKRMKISKDVQEVPQIRGQIETPAQMDGWIQYKRSDTFHASLLGLSRSDGDVQTVLRASLLRSEKLSAPSKKCTFPGDKSEATEVLRADGTT